MYNKVIIKLMVIIESTSTGNQYYTMYLYHFISNWRKLTKNSGQVKFFLGIPGPGLPSLKFNVDAKIPNGKAPIPKDIWKPPSPKAKPGKPWHISNKFSKFNTHLNELPMFLQ